MSIDKTPRRLTAIREVHRGEIRWYHFLCPVARNVVSDNIRTDVVVVLAGHGIVDLGKADPGGSSTVTVTDYGRQWAGAELDGGPA